MENNKSPGNNGLAKSSSALSHIFINSLRESKCSKALSTSQRQPIVRLIEKPTTDK